MQENQQLQSGQNVCFVNPGDTRYFAELYISQNNFGKIKEGQKVLLKLPSYPFQEFGAVKGKLDFIFSIPTDSGYTAKVTLPYGLKTNFNKESNTKKGLQQQPKLLRLIQNCQTDYLINYGTC